MKNSKIIVYFLIAFSISCKDIPDKINPELIKSDWIVKEGKYNNTYLLVHDSLMIENLTKGDIPISPYKILYDTLIIYSCDFDYEKDSPSPQREFKLKILKIDSLELLLRPAYPEFKDTIIFKKLVQTKKNDLKIKRLEFSYTGGYGFSQDIKIDSDLTLYHYDYSPFSKHEGLSKCKLDSVMFERIQSMIYAIDRDSFLLRYPGPVTSNFFLFIKGKNDSIKVEGYPDNETDSKLIYVFDYLMLIEYLVNLNNSNNENTVFMYKGNYELYKRYN